ncbi:MAG TPA: WYL domain-containing protein [Candidatus Nanopelagicales bacterium]|jgi:proteasome accessory factor C|nr:WYL domain-containing protein [Candidatus Nanopelagicales bacterium]
MTDSATSRLTRLLALVPWLLARPGIATAEAAEHFGVSEEELQRDLDLLICSGPGQYHGELLDIWYDEGTITVHDPQTLTRPLRLTAEEAAALIVGLRLLAQVPGGHDRAVVDRLAATLEAAAGDAAAEPAVSVAVAVEADPQIVTTVEQALAQGRVLRIHHAGAASDETTVREVVPQSLVSVDGRPYLSGWCRRAGAMRTFRLDRVQSAELLAEHAAIPADVAPVDLDVGALRPDGPPVTLDLAPGARWVADEFPVDSVTERPDGTTRITLPVPDQRWVVRLLLQLGDTARVVDPLELADQVATQARRALAAYT